MQLVTSLRDRKKVRTREALFDAAMKLFEERGFSATTVDDLAAEAHVSRRTFFRYFPEKEAVVFPWDAERLARFEAVLNAAKRGEPPFDSIRRALLALADEYTQQSDDMLAQHRVIESAPQLLAYERTLDRRWEEALAGALGRGARSARKRREARILAGAMMGAIRATLAEWFTDGARGDLGRMGQEALDMIEYGIERGTRPSLKE
ncbi:MAG: TetR family transcriptional regulator [Deltaproteobacteria bacterium]|nr:TetR family transcriptional regulator [Deltaproteobacteria bacterium]